MLKNNSFKEIKTAFLVGISDGNKDICQESLTELSRLCDTYEIKVVSQACCALKKMDAATFLRKGKLNELLLEVQDKQADIIIFDEELTPSQQRNLEIFFQKPIIDRTELIIEVFAQKAQTREARLQVELAKVKYQIPRLKRMWTHLSRQTATGGGGAYLRGAGELQIELDRRTLKKRLQQLEVEIEEVKKKRETQRQKRVRAAIPSFAIVGYTNAGKSTLLNALTGAHVLVEDKLFATLDTTARKYLLPNRQEVVLVDTVGFIRKIPHTLVTAFKSTLEEVLYTDFLIHLIDCSHPAAELQAEATMLVLKELQASSRPIITVLNKIDACSNPEILHKLRVKYPKTIPIAALTHQGFDQLLEQMIEEIQGLRKKIKLRVPQSRYALVSELIQEGRIIECKYEDNDMMLEVEIPSRLEHKFSQFLLI